MKFRYQKCRLLFACVTILCCVVSTHAQKNKRHRLKNPEAKNQNVLPASGVQLNLTDGTNLIAEDAWENSQGVWYQRDGISHLMPRERVKTILRAAKTQPASADEEQTGTPSPAPAQGPAWICFKGGARVEADSVAESIAGVWYKRGSLSVFVDRAQVDHIEREVESVAESDSSSKKDRGWTTGNGHIDGLIKQSGARYGVDPYLIFCVMEQESHFNARAQSPKGARGLMQLMPGTSARFGVRRPSDPAQNIAGGTRYLKQLLDQFNGRIDLVLASYNAGEGAVLKFGGRVPPYRETRDYVKRISYRYRRNRSVALVAPVSSVRAIGN
ncbi:MAG TPA: lytic transglycosylase domain-containing protein [Pyrinomonadaceae bacterium]|nr:lytic transglycosylase domain-containing protein [Pyrinomonadaceae bacterium]